jgi:hypothetical protein
MFGGAGHPGFVDGISPYAGELLTGYIPFYVQRKARIYAKVVEDSLVHGRKRSL